MNNNSDIKSKIIQIIIDDGNRKIPIPVLVRKYLNSFPYTNKNSIYNQIDLMLQTGELRNPFDNKVVLGYIDAPVDLSNIYEGFININSQKDGYIKQFDDEGNVIEEFYVNKIHVNGALRGDQVKFALLEKDIPNGLREASVVEVVKRNRAVIVAEILIDEFGNTTVIPDDSRIYHDIVIENIDIAKNGDKVLLQINYFEKNKINATITRVIGNKNSLGSDIESIVYDNGAEIFFNNDAINESENLSFNLNEEQLKIRKDLRSKNIITIDPATSKDLDDAICVEKQDNGNYKLYVCIADVSYYVRLNTELDNSALNRGTSIYLVDRVVPMLPNNISDCLCSLNQDEEKFCLTAEIDINKNGDIVNFDVYPAIMLNKRRFSYDEVNAYFDGTNQLNDVKQEIKDELNDCLELHHILRKHKYDAGYIEFDIKEPKITLDENGVPISIDIKKSGTAQKMIEDFMVAANEAVTLFAKKHNLDFIYRIHDKPDTKKIENFKIESKKLGFYSEIDYANLQSKSFLNLINKNKDHQEFSLFNKILLRTMQKAKYSVNNIGHFGLAIFNYTHFTSPIRRYSDLYIHRILWMFVFTPDKFTNNERNIVLERLPEVVEQCNFTEIRQVSCERDVNSMKFAEYMSYHVGDIYEGVISTITSFGFFVELDNMIEGLVTIRSLDDDFYTFNPETITIIGRRNQKVYTMGKRVKIQVVSANKNDRKIDFKVIN